MKNRLNVISKFYSKVTKVPTVEEDVNDKYMAVSEATAIILLTITIMSIQVAFHFEIFSDRVFTIISLAGCCAAAYISGRLIGYIGLTLNIIIFGVFINTDPLFSSEFLSILDLYFLMIFCMLILIHVFGKLRLDRINEKIELENIKGRFISVTSTENDNENS